MNPVNTNNYMNYNQNPGFQPYQATQYFPQPQGSIYMIGSSNDVANVPVGAGLSAAICLREGVIYLKTIQNGSPMLLGYRLNPLENTSDAQISSSGQAQTQSQTQTQEPTLEQRIFSLFDKFEERLKKLENANQKIKGGTNEWQL